MLSERPTGDLLNFGGTESFGSVYLELIDLIEPETGIAATWSGYFETVDQIELPWDVQAYTLSLKDGRHGQLMVQYRHSNPTVYVFKGLTPLV